MGNRLWPTGYGPWLSRGIGRHSHLVDQVLQDSRDLDVLGGCPQRRSQCEQSAEERRGEGDVIEESQQEGRHPTPVELGTGHAVGAHFVDPPFNLKLGDLGCDGVPSLPGRRPQWITPHWSARSTWTRWGAVRCL